MNVKAMMRWCDLRALNVPTFAVVSIGVYFLLLTCGGMSLELPKAGAARQPTMFWVYLPLFCAAAVPLVVGDRDAGALPETSRRYWRRHTTALCALGLVVGCLSITGVLADSTYWTTATRNLIGWTGISMIGSSFVGSKYAWLLPLLLVVPLEWFFNTPARPAGAEFLLGGSSMATWAIALGILGVGFALSLCDLRRLLSRIRRRWHRGRIA